MFVSFLQFCRCVQYAHVLFQLSGESLEGSDGCVAGQQSALGVRFSSVALFFVSCKFIHVGRRRVLQTRRRRALTPRRSCPALCVTRCQSSLVASFFQASDGLSRRHSAAPFCAAERASSERSFSRARILASPLRILGRPKHPTSFLCKPRPQRFFNQSVQSQYRISE